MKKSEKERGELMTVAKEKMHQGNSQHKHK